MASTDVIAAMNQVVPIPADGRLDEAYWSRYAQVLAEKSRAALARLPGLLVEVSLSDEQLAAAAAALDSGDAIEFARIWREARDTYVGELIEGRIEDQPWLDETDAAEQLRGIYS